MKQPKQSVADAAQLAVVWKLCHFLMAEVKAWHAVGVAYGETILQALADEQEPHQQRKDRALRLRIAQKLSERRQEFASGVLEDRLLCQVAERLGNVEVCPEHGLSECPEDKQPSGGLTGPTVLTMGQLQDLLNGRHVATGAPNEDDEDDEDEEFDDRDQVEN